MKCTAAAARATRVCHVIVRVLLARCHGTRRRRHRRGGGSSARNALYLFRTHNTEDRHKVEISADASPNVVSCRASGAVNL